MMLWYTSVKTELQLSISYMFSLSDAITDLETWATPKLLQTYILVVDQSAGFFGGGGISQQLFQ